jgi:riboflavin synthase
MTWSYKGMFTGLIESVGEIDRVEPSAAGRRIRIRTSLVAELSLGDSVSVNGVCLTVVSSDDGAVAADVSPETISVTTLGELKPGRLVNLERSMRADARVGGHFVQGHVDATAAILELSQQGESYWLTVSYPPSLAALIVRKGSIAVDGISLTVAGVETDRFNVQIIPFTFRHTNLRRASVRDRVNLECDILGKYVARALEVKADSQLPTPNSQRSSG